AGAGAVVDDDRLPERLGDPFGEQAREDVRAAARRVGHDHRDRPLRIGLGRGRGNERDQHREGEQGTHGGSFIGAATARVERYTLTLTYRIAPACSSRSSMS